jgi:hypothetical protein
VPQAAKPSVRFVRFDIAQARKRENWTALLDGVNAVVNCAGAAGCPGGEASLTRWSRSRHRRVAGL